ncbi:MAG: serine/threonine protein kinase [Archangiaceae bacterium]|nr:serine/threonine protein kinase [Archangiaceae bacterium]
MKTFPRRFGPYELHARIAIGGLFEVFQATRSSSTRRLALCQVQSFVDEEVLTTMFEDLNLAAQVRHPHLLRLEDFGQLEGHSFVCTEFVDGFDVRPRKVKASAAVAAEVCAQLCDALQVAHGMGVVHGDVQPGNVMISRAGDVKLRELGLARCRRGAMSHRGVLVVPLHYLSPEQLRGVPQTFATDVFSMGLVLFELVTGRGPFERGSELGRLKATLHEPVAPEVMAQVPPPLVPIVERALQKDPLRRFESAQAMSEALRAAGGPVRKAQLAEWAATHARQP